MVPDTRYDIPGIDLSAVSGGRGITSPEDHIINILQGEGLAYYFMGTWCGYVLA